MKLRYFLRYYPTLSETFAWGEAQALQALGHSVSCLAMEPRADGALAEALPEWEVRYPPAWPAALPAALRLSAEGWESAAWLHRFQSWRRVCLALWAASTLAPEERLHAHFAGEAAEWAALGSRVRGNPFGVTVHAVDLFRPRASLPELLRQARLVVTISRWNAAFIEERYGVKARVIYCGVRPERWPVAEPGGDGPVVSVGRNVPKKGLNQLAEAIEGLPGARLQLVSDAPGLASERVEVLGLRPQGEIARIFAGASLFALPCRVAEDGDRDGLPVALMEAMAAGLPVLTTTLPGLDELVDEEVGWLVPPDDPEALRQALAQALGDPAERARRGRAARARVLARFTLARQAAELARAWEEVA